MFSTKLMFEDWRAALKPVCTQPWLKNQFQSRFVQPRNAALSNLPMVSRSSLGFFQGLPIGFVGPFDLTSPATLHAQGSKLNLCAHLAKHELTCAQLDIIFIQHRGRKGKSEKAFYDPSARASVSAGNRGFT